MNIIYHLLENKYSIYYNDINGNMKNTKKNNEEIK